MAEKHIIVCDQCLNTTAAEYPQGWLYLAIADRRAVRADLISESQVKDFCSWGCVADFAKHQHKAAVDAAFKEMGKGGDVDPVT